MKVHVLGQERALPLGCELFNEAGAKAKSRPSYAYVVTVFQTEIHCASLVPDGGCVSVPLKRTPCSDCDKMFSWFEGGKYKRHVPSRDFS